MRGRFIFATLIAFHICESHSSHKTSWMPFPSLTCFLLGNRPKINTPHSQCLGRFCRLETVKLFFSAQKITFISLTVRYSIQSAIHKYCIVYAYVCRSLAYNGIELISLTFMNAFCFVTYIVDWPTDCGFMWLLAIFDFTCFEYWILHLSSTLVGTIVTDISGDKRQRYIFLSLACHVSKVKSHHFTARLELEFHSQSQTSSFGKSVTHCRYNNKPNPDPVWPVTHYHFFYLIRWAAMLMTAVDMYGVNSFSFCWPL